jgi:hypothetical protein
MTMKLPRLVLRTDLIKPGDVLLTRGPGVESAAIAALSGGPFSHAAFFVNPYTTFESDGGIVRYKLINYLGSAEHGEKLLPIGEMTGNPIVAELRRHPDIQAVPVERFAEALQQEYSESFGKNYSEYHRLIRLANIPGPLRHLAAETIRLYEIWTAGEKVTGSFCSELVVRIFDRLGLELFETKQRPEEITPNALARSKLSVEPAVIASDDVVIGKGALPISGQPLLDKLAEYGLEGRRSDRVFTRFEKAIDRITAAGVQPAYQKLLGFFHDALERAIVLADRSNLLDRSGMLRRAAGVLLLALDAAPDLAELATRTKPDHYLHRVASEKLCKFTISLSRSEALLAASLTKEAFKNKGGWFAPIERRRRRSELYSVLRGLRADKVSRLKLEREIQSLLSDGSQPPGQ